MVVRRPDPPSVRFVAFVVWGSLLFGILVVGGIAAWMGPGIRERQALPFHDALPITAAVVNVILLAAARFIPRVLPEGMPALTKNIVAGAVSEAGAILGAVAWMLTGSPHATAGMIMGLGGVAMCYPNDARWLALGGAVEERPPPGPPKGDRSGGPGFGAR